MRLLLHNYYYYVAIHQQGVVSLLVIVVHIFRSSLIFGLLGPGLGFITFRVGLVGPFATLQETTG